MNQHPYWVASTTGGGLACYFIMPTLIYLVTQREEKQRDLLTAISHPRWLQYPDMDQPKARRQELHSGPLHAW